ncbi:glycosyl hydrolase family 8 [Frigidibacter mobilis]|uniref:cellulase n=1 Tax=Frigidibacter mobilis TaxID=1335048 RepID=A0A159Z515_9RHOB|nr:glycosyl hydrolase family 8 [Frigidibacter mobilis]AMY70301.1 cellulase [Frigidibacter mobilis]
MLPAAAGFVTATGFILNPSYWMPRAMRDLAAATDQPALARCADGAERLMATLAATGLIPDWIEITADGITPPPARFSADSGYEALRVPLFLVWSRANTHPAVLRFTAAHQAADTGDLRAPTVFERGSGRATEYSTHAGYRAIAALTACAGSQRAGSAIPPFDTAQPYYPATLHLMTLVAQIEGYPRCVPL